MTAINPLSAADVPALSDFAARCFTDTFGHIYAPEDLAAFLRDWNSRDALTAIVDHPGWAIWVAKDATGTIAGFAKMGPIDFPVPEGEPVDAAVELHNLYVAPAAKGSGLAAQLMETVIAAARERADHLYLSVFIDNDRAKAFYRRYGFVDVGPNWFRVGNHIDEDRVWRLDL